MITGANGHIGHALIPVLKEKGHTIISLDKDELDEDLVTLVDEKVTGSIIDLAIVQSAVAKADTIFHLASTLAIPSELNPEEAHETNATGTVNIYSAALSESEKRGHPIQVIFPSSIAVYSLPDATTKESVVITEEEYLGNPVTMYGITKSYCEQLGLYYSDRYKMLDTRNVSLDFRALRLPGVIGETTQDKLGKYAGLTMVHAPSESGGYEVYVKEETVLPYITLSDTVTALISLSQAPAEKLTRRVYNVSGFPATIKDITDMITKAIPDANPSESIDAQRQSIVDSWPQAIDDSKAREDWGWKPQIDSVEKVQAN